MRKLCFFSLLMMLLFSGCLGVKVEETTSPTKEQVNRCRSEMYINPSIRIAPLGFKHVRYRDDAIWFKFKTDVSDVQKIFNAKVVDTSKFQAGFTFIYEMKDLKWWDVKDKNLLGGKVELPKLRFMNVGIEKSNEGYLVYIMWHEV